jgi:hypothetical protein
VRNLRETRAYLAGFGTCGSLLICLALMFIVASALVAFHGWTHIGAQPSPGEVVVSPRPTAATGSAVARRLVLASAAPAPVTRAGATAGAVPAGTSPATRGGAVPGARRSIGRPATTSRPVGAAAAQTAPVSVASPACVNGCGPAPAVAVPAPVQQLQQSAHQGIQQAAAALGKVVGDTGSQVGTVVQQTTNTAAGAVQTVSPPAAGVVKSTGSGAAGLVGGLTKTASGVLSGLGGN